MENQNYTIAEGYELPSKGLIYDKPVKSHVELRSMTARDEMKRLAPSTAPLKVLADIIEDCMLEKPAIHVYDMAVGDYEYLLHRLRVVTYSDNYKMGLTCPFCNDSVEATAHLDDLEVRELDLDKFNSLKSFTLPKSGHSIVLKIQTPRILDNIDLKTKEMKRKYKDANINFETLSQLVLQIDSVDGNKLNDFELENFVNKLPALDMNKILNNIDELTTCVGIKNEFYVTCPKCQHDIKTFFRFGTEFFRPTNI